jgi:D-tyrosyl-tRNA(Tyr) deacylase
MSESRRAPRNAKDAPQTQAAPPVKAVLQRVKEAYVTVEGRTVGEIGKGLLVLVAIGAGDTVRDIDWMVEKIVNVRIFETPEGKLDKSVLDVRGALLLVSQFTLYGDC